MPIWIKIIAKFCFAILLFVSCGDSTLFDSSEGCRDYETKFIPVTTVSNVIVEPDIIIEGDTVVIHIELLDNFPGFTYETASVGIEGGCENVWPSTALVNGTCVDSTGQIEWIVPDVNGDMNINTARIYVRHDSLLNLDIDGFSEINCTSDIEYRKVSALGSVFVLDSDTLAN